MHCCDVYTPDSSITDRGSKKMLKVLGLDHLVLTVSSIPATIDFYTSLGFRHESFRPPSDPSTERHSLKFGSQKINLHEKGKEFEPKAGSVQVGSGDLCFIVADDVETVLDQLKEKGLGMLEGGKVVERTGARGKIRSVYIRDPDGSLLE